MNTRKIFALQRKAEKEAQKAVDKIYKKYSKEMEKLITEQIPKGHTLTMGNGMCWLDDNDGNAVTSGKGWGRFEGENKQLDRLSSLQYSDEIYGSFDLPTKIIIS